MADGCLMDRDAGQAAEAVADLSLSAGLARAAGGVAGVVAALAVLDLVGGGTHRWGLAAGSIAVSAIIAAMGLLHARRPFRASTAGHIAGICAVLCALNSVNHVALTGDPLAATYLLLTLVASGAVLTMARWLVAVDVVGLLGFGPLAATHAQDPVWRHLTVTLAMGVAAAHVLQQLRAQGQAELQRLTEALAVQARRDHLTGLLNRHGLACLVPGLTRPDGPLGVLCLDVDGFKRINDELGHAAGDAVLVEIAGRLRVAATGGAVTVRLGGDEFALLVPDAGPDRVRELAAQLRTSLAGTAGVLALPWSASIGTATGVVQDAHDVERLLASADIAMYDDKQRRRAPVRLAAPAQEAPAPSA